MAEIAGGQATIGSGLWQMASERGFQNERPRHSVLLAAYGIGRYPVTNAQYGVLDPDKADLEALAAGLISDLDAAARQKPIRASTG